LLIEAIKAVKQKNQNKSFRGGLALRPAMAAEDGKEKEASRPFCFAGVYFTKNYFELWLL
jgi:hypothetical protein